VNILNQAFPVVMRVRSCLDREILPSHLGASPRTVPETWFILAYTNTQSVV
jgi:hypothetical protein